MRQVESTYRLTIGPRSVRLPDGASYRRQRLACFMRAALVGGALSLALVAFALLR